MKTPVILIPKVQSDDAIKLYVYRSKDADDINTISKVAKLTPVIVIDQKTAKTITIDGKKYYQVMDEPTDTIGITYNGPQINTVPVTEYETNINIIKLNPYTYVSEFVLSPLELHHKEGIMFYYSVIAVSFRKQTETVDESVDETVDETSESVDKPDESVDKLNYQQVKTMMISHLSKVNGALVDYISKEEMNRQVWSCDNYTGTEYDEWNLVATLEHSETSDDICIGNITRPYNIEQLGIPMIETVPKIDNYKINTSLNSLISDTFMILEVQNPWQNNNERFNYRKLKSYKIRNVYQSAYGEFSVPTFQSLLPVSIEKMIIMMKSNPSDPDEVISIDDESAKKFEIIRRDGLYYDRMKHKSLGYNKWSIPLESNELNVFSESSIQDKINIQISAVTGNLYVFDVYLIDVYENMSENTHYAIET